MKIKYKLGEIGWNVKKVVFRQTILMEGKNMGQFYTEQFVYWLATDVVRLAVVSIGVGALIGRLVGIVVLVLVALAAAKTIRAAMAMANILTSREGAADEARRTEFGGRGGTAAD